MKKLNKAVLDRILRQRLDADLKACRVCGAAILVAQEGEILSEIRAGYFDPVAKTPVLPNTMFRLASMTKPVTGAAALIGMQNGWFDIYDKVSDHLPGFADIMVGRLENGKVVPDHKPVRDLQIVHLLSHANGVIAADEIGGIQAEETPDEAYTSCRTMVDHFMQNCCLSYDPGEMACYSGRVAFDVVACILEEKSGMPFAKFVEENILKPLNIPDLTYRPTEEQWPRFIAMTDRTGDGHAFVTTDMGKKVFEALPLTYNSGGASMAGSLEAYFTFAEMLRNKGMHNGKQIIDPKLMELYNKPNHPIIPSEWHPYDRWGLGVRVSISNPKLPVGSFGWSGAYGTHFWVDPENQITAIYMRNSRWYDSHGGGWIGEHFEEDVWNALQES